LRRLAGRTIDVRAVLGGLFSARGVADRVAAAYREHLYGDVTLHALPDRPRFVLNATNLQSGALWRFSKPYMADYRVGVVRDPDVPLAVAVAASSAFPPVLAPLRLRLREDAYDATGRGDLFRAPFTTDVVLGDGGIYDNLGLETAWKRCRSVLISDGGGQMAPEGRIAGDWVPLCLRVGGVVDNQVRDLRKRQAVAGFVAGDRSGAYWGIRSVVADFGPPPGSLDTPAASTAALAAIPTRLARLDPVRQQRLINWGYAVTDVALRRWVLPDAAPPTRFPYPAVGVG
jgi:NTE family protein